MKAIKLPQPAFKRCRTVFQALRRRRTSREIGRRKLSLQQISDILWAANGVNRARGRGPFGATGRTAGSASNSQEILVYAAMADGTYLYQPEAHVLLPIAKGDLRNLAISRGQSPAGGRAPLRLIYLVDTERFKSAGFQEPGLYDPERRKAYYFVDTGLIAQNVYLAAAALGLATWFHNCDRKALKKALGLGRGRQALFGQTVGHEDM